MKFPQQDTGDLDISLQVCTIVRFVSQFDIFFRRKKNQHFAPP